jgi:hypothetical protein
MSGLTGYLTQSGTDLSSIFLSNNGGVFTNVITTSAGIIGPSTSISYSAGMIGFTTSVPANRAGSGFSSGTYTLLTTNSFTIPIGVYLINAYVSNTYTHSSGTPSVQFVNIYISTASNTYTAGCWGFVTGSMSLPTTTGSISGGMTTYMQVTTATAYYFLETVAFTSIVVSSDSTPANSYLTYTRLA